MKKFGFITLLVVAVLGIGVVGAENITLGGGDCYGTYVVDVGAWQGIWTFSKDGTFQGTNSAEQVFDFSHQQGAWTHSMDRNIRATWIDFTYDKRGNPTAFGRDDAELTFENGCQYLKGTTDVRIYGLTEDPLDPTGGSPVRDLQGVEITGQKLNPK